MLTGLDVLVLTSCAAWLLGRPLLWLVYRLCPLDDHLPPWLHEMEPRIPLDKVLGVWWRETWGHLYRVRQHVLSDWEDVRWWARRLAEVRIAERTEERAGRLAGYLAKVLAYEAPKPARENVTKISVRSGH